MAVALPDSLEVSADHREAQIDRFGPAAVDENDRLALPGSGGQTPGIDGPAHHTGAEDHQIEGVDECCDHRGREIDRWSADHGKPVEGDPVITGGSKTKGRESNQRRPRTDPYRFGHGDEQHRRSGDLHHTPPSQPTSGEQRRQVFSDREEAFTGEVDRTGALTKGLEQRCG